MVRFFRDRFRAVLLGAALVLWAGLWWQFFPIASSTLRLAVPLGQGEFAEWAEQYAQAAARYGVTVQVVPVDGPQDALNRLSGTPAAEADLAFLPGGFGALSAGRAAQGSLGIQTLANLTVEPLWIFSRLPDMTSLASLVGTRVAAGTKDSASRVVVSTLLDLVPLDSASVSFIELNDTQAVEAFRAGQVDTVVVLGSQDVAPVKALLAMPQAHLVSLRQVHSLTERAPYLSSHLLAKGGLDSHAPLPTDDVVLLGLTASLVTRESLDPSLKRMATAVVPALFAGPGLLHGAGEFPNLTSTGFAPALEARKTLSRGSGWLEEYVGYWPAQAMGRVVFLGIPMLLVAVCLGWVVQLWIQWKAYRSINRCYGQLKYIEDDLGDAGISGLQLSQSLARLKSIEKTTFALKAPRELTQRVYTLTQHIAFVRREIFKLRGR